MKTTEQRKEIVCPGCGETWVWVRESPKDSTSSACERCSRELADAFWAMGEVPGRQVSVEQVSAMLGRHEHGSGR